MKTLLQNRYELLEIIGDGGMATVYKAHCTLLDRVVAVKILKEEHARDSNFVLKFRSEAQAAARLSHPNIVNVYDVGEDQGLNFIVMEYVEGINLKELIAQRGPLPPDETVKISMMICDALKHAHDRGLIHRDIKPHNILITGDGTVKVADFGIAHAATSVTITYSGNMVGSVHYVSPEQARGEPVDNTSDLYSLGCVMYEMLTGRVPFDADSPVTVALKHIHETPKSISVLNEAVSRELETVVLTAMEKNPAYRYQSAQEMKQALYKALYGKGKGFKKKNPHSDKTIIMPAIGEGEEYDLAGRKKRRISPTGYVFILVIILGFAAGVLFSLRGSVFGQVVTVPNLVGSTLREARDILDKNNLKLEFKGEIYSDEYDKGEIISQDPEPEIRVKAGRKIKVVVSKGPEMVKVPDITGESLDNAKLILSNKGLKLGEVGESYDANTPEGVIVSQNPDSGKKVESGTKVDVTVNSKASMELTMRNLVGETLDNASSWLEKNNLVLERVDREYSSQYTAGKVISQSIPPGETVVQGTPVVLVVSLGSGSGTTAKTQTIEYTMPPSSDYSLLTVMLSDDRGNRRIYSNTHLGGFKFTKTVEYYGKGTVTFIVDGQELKKINLE